MSKTFERAGDDAMAPLLARHLNWPLSLSSLEFEGGNIVVDEEKVFIGENTIILNAITLNKAPEEIVEIFQTEFKREVMVIGPAPQPIPHIDMMLTPLGNNKIAIADSKLGAKIVKNILDTQPEAIQQFEKKSEQWFFGHPDIQSLQLINGETYPSPELEGATPKAIEESFKLAEYLDALAETFEQRDYQVFRIPLLQQWDTSDPTKQPQHSDTADKQYRPRLDYPILTYNNVLLEQRQGGNRVYLPQYGLLGLDLAAENHWQQAGFDVVKVSGFTTSALYGGALRCSVKVLQRSE